MAPIIYILGTLITLLCCILLLRGYARSRQRLLLWSGLCFAGLALSNALLIVDLVILGDTADLYLVRLGTAAVAMALLVYGLVWETE
jgi:uncharacterized protein DUF5985